MISNEIINQVTKNMFDWLNSWRQSDGAYNGWVVHRFDLKRLKYIHDTPWEQTPMIDGLINLYKKTNNVEYYNMAKQSAMLQISRLDKNTGMFDNAGFEDDRFSSLVHNALADCSLLSFAEICTEDDCQIKRQALETVKCNLDKYFFGVLYCEDAMAFKFNVYDYYWPQENRYVANMNSVAIEAMMRYASISGEYGYRDIALKVLKSVVELACKDEGTMQNGGIGYANTHPDWYVSIYTALALRGICEVYKYNKDKKLEEIMLAAARHLLRYTENDYFCHAIHNGIENRYPYWIAGGGMILKGIDDVSNLLKIEFTTDKIVNNLIMHQQKCGGISSFKKYNSKDNHRKNDKPDAQVWEDIAPGPPWNAHLFEYLTRFVDYDFDMYASQNKTSFVINRRYLYYESAKYFGVLSFLPLYSCAFVWIKKDKNKSISGFSLRDLYKVMRIKYDGYIDRFKK